MNYIAFYHKSVPAVDLPPYRPVSHTCSRPVPSNQLLCQMKYPWRHLAILSILHGALAYLNTFPMSRTARQSGSWMRRFALADGLSSVSNSKFHSSLCRKIQQMRDIRASNNYNDDSSDAMATRPLGQHLTLLIDGDNVRGKTSFRLNKDHMIEYLQDYLNFYLKDSRERGGGSGAQQVYLDMILYFDHGMVEQAFHLPITNGNPDGHVNLCVVFAGPQYKADDIIARDASWFADKERLHDYLPAFASPHNDTSSIEEKHVVSHSVVTVTQDRGLRRRVKPKNSSRRLTKKQRKALDQALKREAELAKTQRVTVSTDISVLSSHLLADMLIDIHKHTIADKDDQEQVLSESAYMKEYQAMRSLLKREVEVTEKVDSIHRRLKRSMDRDVNAKLKADIEKAQHQLENIHSEYSILDSTVKREHNDAAMEKDMVRRGCVLLRQSMASSTASDTSSYRDEETWERSLFAEEMRRKLTEQRSAAGEKHGEERRIELYVANVNANVDVVVENNNK